MKAYHISTFDDGLLPLLRSQLFSLLQLDLSTSLYLTLPLSSIFAFTIAGLPSYFSFCSIAFSSLGGRPFLSQLPTRQHVSCLWPLL
jgi:hypothetical protein